MQYNKKREGSFVDEKNIRESLSKGKRVIMFKLLPLCKLSFKTLQNFQSIYKKGLEVVK